MPRIAATLLKLCLLVSAPVLLWSTTAAAATQVGPLRDCFAGPLASHESWMAMLSAKRPNSGNTEPDLQELNRRFPKALHEQRKASLDCQNVLYEVDGIHVTGYILKPKSATGKLPVLVYNRGGNAELGALWFSGEIWHRLMPLAEAGFLVLASQYRGGRPLPPGFKTGNDEFGGAEVADVLALLELAEQMPQADLTRIGVAGHSRGGMMSYLVAKQEPRIRAMATLAGPVDLLSELSVRPEMENVYRKRIPNYETEKEPALRARSPIFWVEQLPATLPILIIHGERDERVSVSHAHRMAAKLTELGRPHQLLLYPNSMHSLDEDNDAVNQELVNWFRQYLAIETATAQTAQ